MSVRHGLIQFLIKTFFQINAALDEELKKHGIDKENYLARQCTLYHIRKWRKVEPGDFIPAGMPDYDAVTGADKLTKLVEMNTLDLRIAAEHLLAARPSTRAIAMAHYNLLELIWGIEEVQIRTSNGGD